MLNYLVARKFSTKSLSRSKVSDSEAIASGILMKTKPISLGKRDDNLLRMLRHLFCASGEGFYQTLYLLRYFLFSNYLLRDEKLQDVIRRLHPQIELFTWTNLNFNKSGCIEAVLFKVLHAAIAIGLMDLVRTMLVAGLNPNPSSCKASNITFLEAAVMTRRYKITEVLLKFDTDLSQISHQQKTILELAVERGDMEVVRLLLKAGAPVNAPQNRACLRTALVLALTNRHIEIAKLMIEYGAKVDAVGQNISSPNYSWSCLTAAVFTGNIPIVTLILPKGAAVNYQYVRDWNGLEVRGITALHAACKVGCSNLVYLLLKVAGIQTCKHQIRGPRYE
jgi:ankyrin repeat protein